MASTARSFDPARSREPTGCDVATSMAAISSLLADGLGAIGKRFVLFAHHPRRELDDLLSLRNEVLQREHLHFCVALDVVGEVADGIGGGLPVVVARWVRELIRDGWRGYRGRISCKWRRARYERRVCRNGCRHRVCQRGGGRCR